MGTVPRVVIWKTRAVGPSTMLPREIAVARRVSGAAVARVASIALAGVAAVLLLALWLGYISA